MSRFLQTSLTILALTIAVVVGAIGFAGYQAISRFGDTIDGFNTALVTINHPCAPGPCGTLAEIDKTVVKVGDAIVTTQLQERATAPHVVAAMDTFKDTAAHLSGTANSLSGTADALTQTAKSTTETLKVTQTTIKDIQPILSSLNETAEASTVTINSLNTRISDPHIDAILGHVDSTIDSLSGIMADGKKVTDKATADYLAPQPWWKKVARYASDTYDYGALFARHTP
jgi:ABC-type transporter Mla subunit MlaD